MTGRVLFWKDPNGSFVLQECVLKGKGRTGWSNTTYLTSMSQHLASELSAYKAAIVVVQERCENYTT